MVEASCEIALIWLSLDFTDDQSTLVQVMAWCRQATSHYLSQCWPSFLSPYGVIRPQWVKSVLILKVVAWYHQTTDHYLNECHWQQSLHSKSFNRYSVLGTKLGTVCLMHYKLQMQRCHIKVMQYCLSVTRIWALGSQVFIRKLHTLWDVFSHWYKALSIIILHNRHVARIPYYTSPISHNAPFCNRNVYLLCAHFCLKMVHCRMFVYCIVGFVTWVNACTTPSNHLYQYWLIVSWNLRNKFQWNSIWIFISRKCCWKLWSAKC